MLFQKSYTAYLIIRKKEIVLFKSVESKLKIIFPAKCLMNLETYSQSSELRTGVPFKHREGKKYFSIQSHLILSVIIQHHCVQVTLDCLEIF